MAETDGSLIQKSVMERYPLAGEKVSGSALQYKRRQYSLFSQVNCNFRDAQFALKHNEAHEILTLSAQF